MTQEIIASTCLEGHPVSEKGVSNCVPCRKLRKKIRSRKHYCKHKEKLNARSRKYYADNRERLVAIQSDYTKKHSKRIQCKRYGITVEQYDILFDAQAGVCFICRDEQIKGKLVVDHDHETGEVRGLLCNNCNAGIGMLRDSQKLVAQALRYLKWPPANMALKLAALKPQMRGGTII